MKTAVIIHGMPSKENYFDEQSPSPSNHHWFPWLQRELLLNGVLAQTPEFPVPYEPDYKKWKAVFEQFKLDEETILVGHSCGGGFLVRWLSENSVKVGRVVLVAPWIDPNHDSAPKMFADMAIDANLATRTKDLTLFISLDDDKEELDTAEQLKATIKGLQVVEFTDKGHFTMGSMKTSMFPELRNYLLN